MDLDYYKNTLEKAGVKFEKGLTDVEIRQIEIKYEFLFPPDLIAFRQNGLPVSNNFCDWRNLDERKIVERLNCPFEGMCFDIEYNMFWLEQWGTKPINLDEAFIVAKEYVKNAPTLIPIFGHRYIPASPHESGNPIFSVYQTDIIYYGASLADYLEKEFSYYFDKKRKQVNYKRIEFWTNLVEINNGY